MSGLVGAIALLTRIPVRTPRDAPPGLARSVPWFPVVGTFVGAAIALVYIAGTTILPPLIAATLAMAAGALITGAFHEDGLGDVADAFAGGYTIERRLQILDDPRHGTFGVLAIAIALLLRVGAIAGLDPWDALALIPAAHAISRSAAIGLMRRLPAVSERGMGASYAGSLTVREELVGIGTGVAIGAALIGGWAAVAIALSALVAVGMGALAKAKIGGISGDALGATQQAAEIAVLLMGAALLHEGWGSPAWWRP